MISLLSLTVCFRIFCLFVFQPTYTMTSYSVGTWEMIGKRLIFFHVALFFHPPAAYEPRSSVLTCLRLPTVEEAAAVL